MKTKIRTKDLYNLYTCTCIKKNYNEFTQTSFVHDYMYSCVGSVQNITKKVSLFQIIGDWHVFSNFKDSS